VEGTGVPLLGEGVASVSLRSVVAVFVFVFVIVIAGVPVPVTTGVGVVRVMSHRRARTLSRASAHYFA